MPSTDPDIVAEVVEHRLSDRSLVYNVHVRIRATGIVLIFPAVSENDAHKFAGALLDAVGKFTNCTMNII